MNKELNRFEQELSSKLELDRVEKDLEKERNNNIKVEQISNIIPAIEDVWPQFNLEELKSNIENRTEQFQRAKKLKAEVDNIYKNDLEKAKHKLQEKYLDKNDANELKKLGYDITTVEKNIRNVKDGIKELVEYRRIFRPIRELISQPLLLYLIGRLNIDLEQNNEIRTRSALYKELINKLTDDLFSQIVERTVYDSSQSRVLQGLRKSDYRQFIRELAFAIFAKGTEVISFSDADKYVQGFGDKFNYLRDSNPDFLNSLLPTFYFKKSDGYEDNEGAIEFAHKSFREYMTAELIWDSLYIFSKEPHSIEKRNNLLKMLGIRVMTSDLLEFVGDIALTTCENMEFAYKELGILFVEFILDRDFFNENTPNSISAFFYNTLGIMKKGNAYSLFPETLNNIEKKNVFIKYLQVFLSEHEDIEVDVSNLMFKKGNVELNTDNVKFCLKPYKQEDYDKSLSFRDFYL